MEAPNLVPLPSRPNRERPIETARTLVRLEPDRLVVDHLAIVDPALAAIVADRPDDERSSFVERALRIGLLALQSAGTTLNV
ncbi:MAG TPA: hypothetical protein VFI28_03740, partial [Candidatus Limnocylindrales bacterium]|nr:hypothetical protein [Candidatus Limnocylindrales bacterium]